MEADMIGEGSVPGCCANGNAGFGGSAEPWPFGGRASPLIGRVAALELLGCACAVMGGDDDDDCDDDDDAGSAMDMEFAVEANGLVASACEFGVLMLLAPTPTPPLLTATAMLEREGPAGGEGECLLAGGRTDMAVGRFAAARIEEPFD
jgi:hypothetical protein